MKIALSLLLCLVMTAGVWAQEPDSVVTAAAVDGAGRAWAAARTEEGIICFRRDSTGWRAVARVRANNVIAGPVLAFDGAAMVCGWIDRDTEGTPVVSMRRIVAGRIATLTAPPADGLVNWRDLALAAGGDGNLRLVLTGAEQVRYVVYDAAAGWRAQQSLSIVGSAVRPVILAGNPDVFAWEERSQDNISVAIAPSGAMNTDDIIRFSVSGFAGEAIPALARGEKPTVYWQETDEFGRARIARRALDGIRMGPIELLETPPGFSGLAGPRRAVDDERFVTAYGWTAHRWAAVRFEATAADAPSARVPREGAGLRRPFMVKSGAEDALWISGASLEGNQPLAFSERNLAHESPAPAVSAKLPAGSIRLLCFGDSITFGTTGGVSDGIMPGYREPLSEAHEQFIGPVQIEGWTGELGTDGGWPGEKTPEGLLRLPQMLESYENLDYVLILEGTNDHFWPTPLTIEESAENVGLMADLVRAAGARPIVGTMVPRSRHDNPAADERARTLNKPLIAAAQKRGITLAQFHTLFPMLEENYDDPDGRWLHPSAAGYAIMADIWMRALATFEGDFDRDGVVTLRDARLASVSLGLLRGAALFIADCDVDDDGRVTTGDVAALFRHLGRRYRAVEP